MALEDDYRKFLASAPVADREIRTIELYHSQFPSVLRFVADYVDNSLTLESGAPRNASEIVSFQAIAMQIVEPAEGVDSDQKLSIAIGATSNEVENQIKNITDEGYLENIEAIYRKYYSKDTSEPVVVMYLSVDELSFEGYSSVKFTADDVDFDSKSSGEIYTTTRFPGLAP